MPNKKPIQQSFENSKYKIDVVKHPHPDVFRIIELKDRLEVQRIDQNAGWKMDLLLNVYDKANEKSRVISVGPSGRSAKKIEIPKWVSCGNKVSGPKMAVILAGEAFRFGGQAVRVRDVEKAFEPQRRACFSHVSFFDRLKETKNLNCELFISSYSTKHQQDLLGWYGERLASYSFKENLIGLQGLIKDAIQEINFEEYESLLITRLDIEFKEYLSRVFDPTWNKIMFPSACWKVGAYLTKGRNWTPRISDTMEFVPRRLFGHVKRQFHLSHEAWLHYKRSGLTNSDLGLILDTYHDSDSAKDYNPLYKMAGRSESRKFHSPNFKMGGDLAPQKHYRSITFPDWQQADTEPYEDEDFLVSPSYEEFARPEVFEILLDKDSRKVTVKRKDNEGGWSQRLILMVKFKKDNQEKFLFVGESKENSKSVPLDQRLNFYEDEHFVFQIKEHKFPDSFLITRKDDELTVLRVDSAGAWKHPHAIWAKEKSTGKSKLFSIGPSKSCSKTIWIDLNKLRSERPKIGRVALCMSSGAKDNQIDHDALIISSIQKHIIEPNKSINIDIFVHSWGPGLCKELKSAACLIENSEMYEDEIRSRCFSPKDFSGVCLALSMKRVIQIKEEHERVNGVTYDAVLICGDVPMQEDIDLQRCNVLVGIFTNEHSNYFLMSSGDAKLFKGLYDSPFLDNPHKANWIKNYIEKVMAKKLIRQPK